MVDEQTDNNAEKAKALKRSYQRTTSNDAFRENRKTQYIKAKAEYQAAVRKEKTRTWKEYCTMTSPFNACNKVYKLASIKTRSKTMIYDTTKNRMEPKPKTQRKR
jgi:hypothetical protein